MDKKSTTKLSEAEINCLEKIAITAAAITIPLATWATYELILSKPFENTIHALNLYFNMR